MDTQMQVLGVSMVLFGLLLFGRGVELEHKQKPDGKSWPTAYQTIGDALKNAKGNRESIFVSYRTKPSEFSWIPNGDGQYSAEERIVHSVVVKDGVVSGSVTTKTSDKEFKKELQ